MHTNFYGFPRLALAAAFVAISACSTSDDLSARPSPAERGIDVSNLGSNLTTACRLETVGLPCDPDGAGSATECEGVCWVDDDAEVSCVAVGAANLVETDLNGRVCGDEQGRDCSRSCENGECVDKNARLGTACRPGPNTTSCDGVCTLVAGEPVCDEVEVCADVAIAADGCTLTACNFDTFEQRCVEIELTNQVCEASQVVVDAGSLAADASSPDAASSDSDAGADAGAAQSSAQTDASSPVTTSANTTSSPASTSSPDAGVVDAGAVQRTPTKVVGGACDIAPTTSAPGATLGLLALGWLVARRKRSLKLGAR